MLVLSRKLGEQVVINKDIVVTIARVQGNRVRLSIEAPAQVPIRRGELPADWERSVSEANADDEQVAATV
jgi:carbon storage regulator CsrA